MFLSNLETLMKNHNLNKHSFSVQSGIPYKTIDNFWKKGCDNIKLTTLKRIAEFFNVSLDYLIFGSHIETNAILSQSEKKLIEAYRDHPEMQAAVNKMLDIEAASEETTSIKTMKDIGEEIGEAIKKVKSNV